MENTPIISVSGLRGIVGQSLTPDLAIRYVAALAGTLPPGPIVVTRDSRPSGRMLVEAVQSGLHACGRNTIDAGVAATPTTGVLVRSCSAAGGVQVSASHNPSPYNGLKLFSGEGRVLSADVGEEVRQRYLEGGIDWAPHDGLGDGARYDDSEDPHAKHLALVLRLVDRPAIQRRRFKVLLDSNHGAGALLGARLLEELGCEVVAMGATADGQFAHPPEPTAENLKTVAQQTASAGIDVAFCQDPDADRLAVIDSSGRYLGEEYTLALCLDWVLRKRKGPIVVNCATSRMAQDLAARHGVEFFRAAVGEANVAEMMLNQKAVFGGEGNGGPIDPQVGYVRDSFVGMALLLDAMAAITEQGSTIGQWADQLPRYEIVKTKIELEREKIPSFLDALEQQHADAQPSRLDGLRLDWNDRWLLVRPSNTEPIVRLIAEAATLTEARKLCETAAASVPTR